MKLVRLIETCLKEAYGKASISKYLSDNIPIQNGLKQDALLPLFFSLDLEHLVIK
jgi:hypothetical protein